MHLGIDVGLWKIYLEPGLCEVGNYAEVGVETEFSLNPIVNPNYNESIKSTGFAQLLV